MSEEERELREFQHMLELLTLEAKNKHDLGINLIESLSVKFDDFLVYQKLIGKNPNDRFVLESFRSFMASFFKILKPLNCVTIFYDPVVSININKLAKNGLIILDQINYLNILEMITFDEDGHCLSFLALTRKDSLKADTNNLQNQYRSINNKIPYLEASHIHPMQSLNF